MPHEKRKNVKNVLVVILLKFMYDMQSRMRCVAAHVLAAQLAALGMLCALRL